MTITEAKAIIYANVVHACEKAGFTPQTTRLVQDACDTIIAIADACETIVALADRKTENSSEKPNNCEGCKYGKCTEAEREFCKNYIYLGTINGHGVAVPRPKDEPQTNGYQIFNVTSVYVSRLEDEPQTERSSE